MTTDYALPVDVHNLQRAFFLKTYRAGGRSVELTIHFYMQDGSRSHGPFDPAQAQKIYNHLVSVGFVETPLPEVLVPETGRVLERPVQPDRTTHDYTRRRWGHDFVIREVHDGGQGLDLSGWGRGIAAGHRLILPESDNDHTCYTVTEIEYCLAPSDMWHAKAVFTPRTDVQKATDDAFVKRGVDTLRLDGDQVVVDAIPPELRALGVIDVIKTAADFSDTYTFKFADAESLVYRQPAYSWGERAKTRQDLINAMCNAILERDHLPFDEIGGA